MPLGSKIISLGGTDPSDDVIGKKSCVLVFLLPFCSFTYFFLGGAPPTSQMNHIQRLSLSYNCLALA